MAEKNDGIEESVVRTRIITELLEGLAESRKIMLDQNKDLKTRERWTQLHNSTSQILNTVLRDLQNERLGEEAQGARRIQTLETKDLVRKNIFGTSAGFEGFIR